MKMLGSFCVGALAGFLLGSTKQGCAMRKDVDNMLHGLFSEEPAGKELEDETKPEEPLKRTAKIKLRKAEKADYDSAQPIGAADDAVAEAEAPMPVDNGPLGIDKAHELAEKLGAKVTEITGEESLPHSHHIDIPINKLSA